MGKPSAGNAALRRVEKIDACEQTPGSETSQYREEKKENSIPLVVASERGAGQTTTRNCVGVAGLRHRTVER